MIVNDLFEAPIRVPGLINPDTGLEWSNDELLAPRLKKNKKSDEPAVAEPIDFATIRAQKQKAAAQAAQAQMGVAKPPAPVPSPSAVRKAKQAFTTQAARSQMANIPSKPVTPVQPSGVSMPLKPYQVPVPSVSAMPVPKVPTAPGVLRSGPKVTSGGPTPAERQALEKRIAAAAKAQPAVAECIQHVTTMLESVTCKKDVSVIREYIDSTLTQTNQQEFRRALHEKVTVAAALRRRIAAQQAAQ